LGVLSVHPPVLIVQADLVTRLHQDIQSALKVSWIVGWLVS
jgi:hypothetical protein